MRTLPAGGPGRRHPRPLAAFLFHPGAVTVNFAVNILTRCKVTRLTDDKIRLRSLDTKVEEEFRHFQALCAARKFKHPLAAHLARFFAPDGGFEVETHSESPAGAGISGSSALMIATTAALAKYTGRKLDREQIRRDRTERGSAAIKVPTGCQDYYPALYGGVSAIHLILTEFITPRSALRRRTSTAALCWSIPVRRASRA